MSKENFGVGFIIGVGVGALVGAAIGLLSAPKSGEETREELNEYLGIAKDKAAAYAAIAQEKGYDLVDKGKEYFEKVQDAGSEVIEKGKCKIGQLKLKKEETDNPEEFTFVEENETI